MNDLQDIGLTLRAGKHEGPKQGACVMEAVAMLRTLLDEVQPITLDDAAMARARELAGVA